MSRSSPCRPWKLTLSVLGCVGMACIMADATLDLSSNTPPANMEDCRKKFRREVTGGLSDYIRDHKAAMDAGGAASIAELTRGCLVSQPALRNGTAFTRDLARLVVQQDVAETTVRLNLQHGGDGIGDGVERAARNSLPIEPVIFDESNRRRLIQ